MPHARRRAWGVDGSGEPVLAGPCRRGGARADPDLGEDVGEVPPTVFSLITSAAATSRLVAPAATAPAPRPPGRSARRAAERRRQARRRAPRPAAGRPPRRWPPSASARSWLASGAVGRGERLVDGGGGVAVALGAVDRGGPPRAVAPPRPVGPRRGAGPRAPGRRVRQARRAEPGRGPPRAPRSAWRRTPSRPAPAPARPRPAASGPGRAGSRRPVRRAVRRGASRAALGGRQQRRAGQRVVVELARRSYARARPRCRRAAGVPPRACSSPPGEPAVRADQVGAPRTELLLHHVPAPSATSSCSSWTRVTLAYMNVRPWVATTGPAPRSRSASGRGRRARRTGGSPCSRGPRPQRVDPAGEHGSIASSRSANPSRVRPRRTAAMPRVATRSWSRVGSSCSAARGRSRGPRCRRGPRRRSRPSRPSGRSRGGSRGAPRGATRR